MAWPLKIFKIIEVLPLSITSGSRTATAITARTRITMITMSRMTFLEQPESFLGDGGLPVLKYVGYYVSVMTLINMLSCNSYFEFVERWYPEFNHQQKHKMNSSNFSGSLASWTLIQHNINGDGPKYTGMKTPEHWHTLPHLYH